MSQYRSKWASHGTLIESVPTAEVFGGRCTTIGSATLCGQTQQGGPFAMQVYASHNQPYADSTKMYGIWRYEWTPAQVIHRFVVPAFIISVSDVLKAVKDQMGIILLNSRIFGESRKVKLPPRLKEFIKKEPWGHDQHTSSHNLLVGVSILSTSVAMQLLF